MRIRLSKSFRLPDLQQPAGMQAANIRCHLFLHSFVKALPIAHIGISLSGNLDISAVSVSLFSELRSKIYL